VKLESSLNFLSFFANLLVVFFCFDSKSAFGEVVVLPLGEDLQSIIEKKDKGTHYQLSAGVHRGHEIILKEGDSLTGENGAILSGAELLEGWRYESPYWVHDGPHSKLIPYLDDESRVWEQRANYPHDLFCNDVPLNQRMALSKYLLSGKFWFYDYEKDKVYIGFDPSGLDMELSGLSNFGIKALDEGVTLKNLKIENYATYNLTPAVDLGPKAIVENCTVSGSHCIGIRISNGTIVKRSIFNYNGLAGLHNGGDGTLIEFSEFGYNGWAGFSGDWARGGCKVPGVTNTIIRRNYAHHNTGPGFWFDINANGNLFEENLSEFNSWEGLIYEVSCGCEIRNNILRWNGLDPRGGLLWGVPFVIQNAEDANVHNNYLESSSESSARGGGVTIINQYRPQHTDGFCGEHTAEGNIIYDNTIVMPVGGYTGLQYGSFGWETYGEFLKKPNVWRNNNYYSGRPNSGNFHWYGPGQFPNDFITQFYNWEQWRAVGQDIDSDLMGKHSSFFNSNSEEISQLIIETTGVSYEELKAPFIDSFHIDDIDHDSDGLPDSWETFYGLDTTKNDSDEDFDGDGIVNVDEFKFLTNPSDIDTDDDGIPDNWEIRYGLNPKSADPLSDPDNDSLTNIEEYEIGSQPNIYDLHLDELPLEGLNMWLKSSVINYESIGLVPLWSDHRGNGVAMKVPFNREAPSISRVLSDNYPMLDFSEGDLRVKETNVIEASNGGWTIFSVMRPKSVKSDGKVYALMGNDVWRKSGFRLVIKNGYLRFYSTQPENAISVEAFQKVVSGQTFVLTLQYDTANELGILYLNGAEQARVRGKIHPNDKPLWLGHIGGMDSQDADYAEVMTYNKFLDHRQRRIVESMLIAKHLNLGLGLRDTDKDGMADWWELEFGSRESPHEDDDFDGLNNYEEFINRTDPSNKDSDKDGLEDLWEISNEWDPLMNDLLIDVDGDGLNSVKEMQIGTNPQMKDTDLDQMTDGWEYENGINPLFGNGTEDPDRDGLINFSEFEYQTNPLNPDTDFDTLSDAFEISKGLDPLENAKKADTDKDGLTDFEEFSYGTNIFSSDSDGDRIFDDDEIRNGLDPLKSDSEEDPDSDGLSNLYEINYRTNPFEKDTDKDGVLDGWEVTHRMNPLYNDAEKDFDFDGHTNSFEFLNNTNPIEWIDVDDDGMHDSWEKKMGLNHKRNDSYDDTDGDHVSNLIEFVLGGHPLSANVTPQLQIEIGQEKEIKIQYDSLNFRYYFYEITLQKMGSDNVWKELLSFDYQLKGTELSREITDIGGIFGIYRISLKRLP